MNNNLRQDRAARRQVCMRYFCAIVVGNIGWEAIHLPLYTLWQSGTRSYLTFVVFHCSAGDLMIATIALIVAGMLAGRGWPLRNYNRVAVLSVVFGLVYTVFSEWLNISIRGSWAYTAAMPVIPILGTGLSPVLQWIVVPVASFALARPRTSESSSLPQVPLEAEHPPIQRAEGNING